MFSKVAATFPPEAWESSSFSTSSPTLMIPLSDCSQPSRCEAVCHCDVIVVLIGISLMAFDIEHLVMCLFLFKDERNKSVLQMARWRENLITQEILGNLCRRRGEEEWGLDLKPRDWLMRGRILPPT